MELTVTRRADTVATLRHVSVAMMETLAGWVPTTPEMELKILFGRHLWDMAQHADAFGNRTAELRLGMHASREPLAEFAALLERVSGLEATADRLAGFYDVLIPQMESRCQAYLDHTDRMMDEPTVRIIERVLTDYARLRTERSEVEKDAPIEAGPQVDPAELLGSVDTASDWVDYRPVSTEA